MPESPAALAGELTVLAGAPRGLNLRSSRPDWMGRIAPGQPLEKLPGLLAAVFNQCGEAHRLCAQLAIDAARGQPAPVPAAVVQRLHMETLREHLRRITLDWPRRLAPGDQAERFQQRAIGDLRAAPVLPGAPLADWMRSFDALGPWLARTWLGLPASEWLGNWRRDPRGWLAHWSDSAQGWLPELLRACRAPAQAVRCAAPALRVHERDEDLRAFAAQLERGEFPAREPMWRGACAETGPWTRLADLAPLAQPSLLPSPLVGEGLGERGSSDQIKVLPAHPPPHPPLPSPPPRGGREQLPCSFCDSPPAEESALPDTPWLRLGARLAEAVQLAIPGAPRLAAGRLALEANCGLAWVEMARGLLMHRVRIDGERVARCEVLAPTEWNFHPFGAVAQAIETLDGADDARIIALMTAYDPCVDFRLAPAPQERARA